MRRCLAKQVVEKVDGLENRCRERCLALKVGLKCIKIDDAGLSDGDTMSVRTFGARWLAFLIIKIDVDVDRLEVCLVP